MAAEHHALYLGKLHGNLNSLEILLRNFLFQVWKEEGGALPGDWAAAVGQKVQETPITDWRTLGELIDDFNGLLARRGLEGSVDKTIANLRDAFAHGRIMLHQSDPELRLIKFGRPSRGEVRVEFNQLLTAEWLSEQIRRVSEAICLVSEVAGAKMLDQLEME